VHELPATEGILATALETAAEAGAEQVLAIDLVIGDLSSIVDDSVQFYFDILSRDTIADGATLRFRRVPGEALCFGCGHRYTVRPPLDPACPACHAYAVRVSGGDDFFIESIEVSDAGPSSHQDPQGE
jgi:hydrogenase nickel incorporation protein HypA/HybF